MNVRSLIDIDHIPIPFDAARYHRESEELEFRKGKAAFNAEHYNEAADLFRKAYSHGNVLAGVLLGIVCHYKEDYKSAIPLLVSGAVRGCPLGAEWLAMFAELGRGVDIDQQAAEELHNVYRDGLINMCKLGSADAQYVYGTELEYGWFELEDEKAALYWLSRAERQGDVMAALEVAEIYRNGWGVERNENKAAQILLRYSSAQNAEVNYQLGLIYYYGTSVEQNYRMARRHFRRAADRGHADAQGYMGSIYYWGRGISEDYTKSCEWFKLAARQGDKYSIEMLGFAYHYGKGMPTNQDEAFRLFHRAASGGMARSQYMLYEFYSGQVQNGKYRNDKLALHWARASASQEDCFGLFAIGYEYTRGELIEKDYDKARQYLERATDLGNLRARKLLREIQENWRA